MIRGVLLGSQGLRICLSVVASSVPGWGAKILHVLWQKKKKREGGRKTKQKQYCNKFHKDFKNGPHWGNKKKQDWGL